MQRGEEEEGVPMLHAEKLGAGEVSMGGVAGSGVGVEREGACEREDGERERDHGYAWEEIRRRGLGPCVVRALVGLLVCVRLAWVVLCACGIYFLFSSIFVN